MFATLPNPFGLSPEKNEVHHIKIQEQNQDFPTGANSRPTLSAAPIFPPDPANSATNARPNAAAPIRPDGFTYRDLFFAQTGSFSSYCLTIKNIDESLNYRYGVASYDVNTGIATDVPDRGWYDPEDGEVTFPILFGAAFAVTSDGVVDARARTPAQRFNDGRGVRVVAPGSD